jgi:hypothetical protein
VAAFKSAATVQGLSVSQGKPKNKSHWDKSHPGERARDKLRKEVKAGRITKPDYCQLCGHPANLLGHHWRGYAFPLDVWWICNSCNTHKQLTHDGSQTLEQMRNTMQQVVKPKQQQIDNSNLDAKLDLRRYFLDKYHSAVPPDVLDCCQGDGKIWQQLRSEYEIKSYWGVDYKKKKGRLAIDSKRLLSSSGLSQNVIDVDVYGSPWGHWLELIKNVHRPTTVFLTIGDQNSVVLNSGGTGAYYINFPLSTPPCLMGMMGRKIAANILIQRAAWFWYHRSRGT